MPQSICCRVVLVFMSVLLVSCKTNTAGSRAWDAPLEFESGEETILEVPANLMRGAEAVGGRLLITTRRLLFQPHGINIQKNQCEILLRDVIEVEAGSTLGLFPNGMLVRTRNGDFKFVVHERKKLIQLIRNYSAKSSLTSVVHWIPAGCLLFVFFCVLYDI
jgi:hypothetical protein